MVKKEEKKEKYPNEEKSIQTVKNQIMESYQNGVIEDQLKNNRAVHTFNNQKK
ncbi:MAG TPA: hypothetical protein VK142_11855 [Bacillota bacterium]|nr:hypothetical protein [Bacillota bacterium]